MLNALWSRISTVLLLCVASTYSHAQTFRTLATFDGWNGAGPYYMSLVQGIDGALYGTTEYGGDTKTCGSGCGTAFRIASVGSLESLRLAPDTGYAPEVGLLLATDGNLYAATSYGGVNDSGAILKITRTGKVITLYSFCGQAGCSDGSHPISPLIEAADGNFYGTTFLNGANDNGTFFRLTPAGELTTLYNFCGQPDCSDGGAPIGALTQASNGDFYGVTLYGGGANSTAGTLYKITRGGALTTLYQFCSLANCADGADPYGGLIEATDGNLYGTTYTGGANGNYGTFFRVSLKGKLTTLYSFCTEANCIDGVAPFGKLIQGNDGNLYGTSAFGGSNGVGTVFQMSTSGVLTTLHAFEKTSGSAPSGGLVQQTTGLFYGATFQGGDLACNPPNGCGTVFSLDVGLPPFVAFVRGSGRTGAAVGILGQGLTGTTAVVFNGEAARFEVMSDTLIKAAVPPGATTGYVTVTTPGGILTSNVPFHVIP